MERHYGMDWLRVGAFALLILYHIDMVFAPWGFHIKTAQPMAWVEIAMFLTNPWRLSLLFVVSGYASRALLMKSPGIGAFLRSRTSRLLIPLLFGMAVVVPPQSWVEVVVQHGYRAGFLHFWLTDYFRFGTLFGIVMPTWNHLWFVLYLWVYTLGLGAMLALVADGTRAQAAFDRLFCGGARVVWLPILYVVLIQTVLFHRNEDTHDLIRDLGAHVRYVPAFLFGFALAGSRPVTAALVAHWKGSAALAVAAYAVIAALLVAWPDFSFPSYDIVTVFRLARDIETWAAIAALIGIASRFWNRDHKWRPMLTEAVFPFYIIHQTAIVLVEYWVKPLGIGALGEFAVLVPATVAACWGFYLIGREVDWLRPLIGLRPRVARVRASARAPGHDESRLDADDPRWGRSDRAQPDLA
ncbi:acyltransferase [Sphingomonas cannabina]|uniref:acyltransferase family protein n=1 Tax=Sphingomonas cannabina TaxID=2899123 RepID=UPI001F2F0600|nr:acyltransferase [Sphingomonas cannabina]UIJ46453.1 acyltransferase [Sphingomonas cannabina]